VNPAIYSSSVIEPDEGKDSMAQIISDLTRAAVLSMDLQTAIVSIYTKSQPDFLSRVAGVLTESRARAMTVIHVQVGFRPGFPEVSERNQLFGAIKTSAQWQQVFQGPAGAIHPEVAPVNDEPVVVKHRVNAFHGTDLEMILRAKEIDTLILLGIATSGVVLSTLLDASDADYRLIVVKDCCIDLDADVQTCLIEKIFPRRATVLSSDELREALA
jgi:nicotinamidase-related amidase